MVFMISHLNYNTFGGVWAGKVGDFGKTSGSFPQVEKSGICGIMVIWHMITTMKS